MKAIPRGLVTLDITGWEHRACFPKYSRAPGRRQTLQPHQTNVGYGVDQTLSGMEPSFLSTV